MPNTPKLLPPQWSDLSQREFRQRFTSLKSLQDLANFWEIPPYQLRYHAYIVDRQLSYVTFEIPRGDDRTRTIDAPVPGLKYLQRLLHESLAKLFTPNRAAHGFMPGRSIVTNAHNHANSKFVLNLDLENFFPSISRRRIFGRLISAPYSINRNVAHVIAALSTNQYSQLPQGSPSSPVIANILASGLDTDLVKFCRPLGCWYTRYADDLTISTVNSKMPPSLQDTQMPGARDKLS